jgi:hypothetical protein
MSAENDMDPGEIPAYLPELTQIEEEIIARCHVQRSVRKYRGQQYKYTGHCVSFLQNTVKTVSVLPSLPADLDVVIIRPTDEQLRSNPTYQQIGNEFRVRRGAVMEWLRFLKRHHPDYRWITIDEERLSSLPIDKDISASFPSIVDDEQGEPDQGPEIADEETIEDLQQQPCVQSMLPNLQDGSTEVDNLK